MTPNPAKPVTQTDLYLTLVHYRFRSVSPHMSIWDELRASSYAYYRDWILDGDVIITTKSQMLGVKSLESQRRVLVDVLSPGWLAHVEQCGYAPHNFRDEVVRHLVEWNVKQLRRAGVGRNGHPLRSRKYRRLVFKKGFGGERSRGKTVGCF